MYAYTSTMHPSAHHACISTAVLLKDDIQMSEALDGSSAMPSPDSSRSRWDGKAEDLAALLAPLAPTHSFLKYGEAETAKEAAMQVKSIVEQATLLRTLSPSKRTGA